MAMEYLFHSVGVFGPARQLLWGGGGVWIFSMTVPKIWPDLLSASIWDASICLFCPQRCIGRFRICICNPGQLFQAWALQRKEGKGGTGNCTLTALLNPNCLQHQLGSALSTEIHPSTNTSSISNLWPGLKKKSPLNQIPFLNSKLETKSKKLEKPGVGRKGKANSGWLAWGVWLSQRMIL